MNDNRPRPTSLADELYELGYVIDVPGRDPEVVADQVMTRLAESGRGVRTRRPRWRPALAAAFIVLVVLALTPPVRAAVTEWFGVVITQGESARNGDSTVPGAGDGLSLREANDLVPFDPVVPDQLVAAHGQPDGVEVSGDRRVLSLSWNTADGTIRLDQFDGEMAPVFLKQAEHEEITVAGRPAIWIGRPHLLVPLDPDGREYGAQGREAETTLIWQADDVTLRLEGLNRAAAIELAESIAGT
ncbi:MAG TPA: hypothetical protein VFZ37_05475 [Jiangellaceae bacterium]